MSKISYAAEGSVHSWQLEWAGRTLKVETGRFAGQANAACTIQYGDTGVLATAVMANSVREGIDYFPLMVDYEEKFYAAGKIKGSRFIKREGRPSDDAILSGRIVDRSIRPFFNQDSRRETQVVIQTLCWDGANDPDALAVVAASVALHMSDIPWDGPIAAVRMNRIGGQWQANASYEEREKSDLDLLVSVRGLKAVMIEAEAEEVPEDAVLEGINLAIENVQPVLELVAQIREKIGRPKQAVIPDLDQESRVKRQAIVEKVKQLTVEPIKAALAEADKAARNEALEAIKKTVGETFKDDAEYSREDKAYALELVEKSLMAAIKDLYLNQNQRIDGRGFEEIRSLSASVGLLPRTHGSGLFQRGETQALSVVTLGPPSSEQILDTMEENDTKKRYMHHYNFPGFSVGEVRPNRGPGRREIGHGALAEKALKRMIPAKEDFPYTVLVVSEILSSNGSSSMAATCGSTLALMDAGVPIKKPVTGIAMGIITDDAQPDNKYKVLTDIQGAEDHYGEMDFKITGTADGITAIQLDVKNAGLNMDMTRQTFTQAKAARLQILDVILKTIPAPRPELSPYAPRIYTLRIDPEKIGDVIGPKGKIINEIIDATGVDIDIEDDGLVMVTSIDAASADKAIEWIKKLTKEVAVGEEYSGKVVRIMDFGAFVEILPGKDGMVHISELAPFHVAKVTDVVNLGDEIPVKVIEIDEMGRINLSLKKTDYEYPPEVMALADKAPSRDSGGPPRRNGNNHRRPHNHQRSNDRPRRRF
jgi:polyribonucleotide nucleotidyltransferase